MSIDKKFENGNQIESELLRKNLKNRLEKLKKIKKDVESEICLVVSCLKESCNDD